MNLYILSLLNEAKSYLNPDQVGEVAEKNRQQFIDFLKNHKLFDELMAQIEENSSWRELAEDKGVFYVIDIVKITPAFESEDYPRVKLCKFEGGAIPVIELVCKYYN